MKPGEYFIQNKTILLNEDRKTASVKVSNTGDRPVQVGSHFHFFEVNRCLLFRRELSFGMRLDIPSGTAIRFEPGEEKEVQLVSVGGEKRVYGLNDLTAGTVEGEEALQSAVERGKKMGFEGVE